MPPITIGDVPSGLGTPHQYVLFGQNGCPYLLVHAYMGSDESYTFHDALVWRNFLVIGWGHSVFLISLESNLVTQHSFGPSYFSSLHANDEMLLIASQDQLIRIAPDVSVMWKTADLGIDGVLVHDFNDHIIRGSGEWDPPGGWVEFQVCADTGAIISHKNELK